MKVGTPKCFGSTTNATENDSDRTTFRLLVVLFHLSHIYHKLEILKTIDFPDECLLLQSSGASLCTLKIKWWRLQSILFAFINLSLTTERWISEKVSRTYILYVGINRKFVRTSIKISYKKILIDSLRCLSGKKREREIFLLRLLQFPFLFYLPRHSNCHLIYIYLYIYIRSLRQIFRSDPRHHPTHFLLRHELR